jgi:hypothetical protein
MNVQKAHQSLSFKVGDVSGRYQSVVESWLQSQNLKISQSISAPALIQIKTALTETQPRGFYIAKDFVTVSVVDEKGVGLGAASFQLKIGSSNNASDARQSLNKALYEKMANQSLLSWMD